MDFFCLITQQFSISLSHFSFFVSFWYFSSGQATTGLCITHSPCLALRIPVNLYLGQTSTCNGVASALGNQSAACEVYNCSVTETFIHRPNIIFSQSELGPSREISDLVSIMSAEAMTGSMTGSNKLELPGFLYAAYS